jgi:membrane-bound metal-dependent hydrolase YbcI (DUF457 family)
MLVAHLVPGYFASVRSQRTWKPEWNRQQRIILWTAALFSTFAPDLDVIYNALFRGFFHHRILWTHSLFPYLAIGLGWYLLRAANRCPYMQTILALAAIGGFSHIALDVISHGTPLLYPLSMDIFGGAPTRVIEGGLWAYVTDPLFLLEPVLVAMAVGHWIYNRKMKTQRKRLLLGGLASALVLFIALFLLLTPTLQAIVARNGLI